MDNKINYNMAEKEFFSKAFIWSNTLLFEPETAIIFINRCRELNIKILGIDAFRKKNTNIQPDLEHSIDYTNKRNKEIKDTWSEAIEFIQQRKDLDFIFEITSE